MKLNKNSLLLTVFIGINLTAFAQRKNQKSQVDYFPPAGIWQHQTPQQSGLNADSLRAAIAFAIKMKRNHVIQKFRFFCMLRLLRMFIIVKYF